MIINRKICPKGLKNNPYKSLKSISYITIHNTGNSAVNATAKMHSDYQYGGSGGREASWHYTIDDNEIWQSWEDDQMCWHAGDGSGDGNTRSIGIEICMNQGGDLVKATDNAAWLTARLCRAYGIPLQNVVQHNYWSGKNCPQMIRGGKPYDWATFICKVTDNLFPQDTSVADAIGVLVRGGIISSPEYWLANYNKVEFLDKLIINMANTLK
ncbi:hypothetical protein AGMMS49975_26700 [Clostridia bacterium]|nr:hypothetical protein AGMMS49975_26700 [Clostridia bacterium]